MIPLSSTAPDFYKESMSYPQWNLKWCRRFSECPYLPCSPWFQSTDYSFLTTPLALKKSPCLHSAADLSGIMSGLHVGWGGVGSWFHTWADHASPPHNPCPETPIPIPSCLKSANTCEINCQGRWEKTMEQRWEMGNQCQLQGKPWGEAAAPPTVPQKFTLWHCYLLSSPYVPADIWKEPCSSSSFHCPVLLSPVPCFPLHMYSHSFLL